MTDVLLAHSYFLPLDAKQAEKMRPYPPLATLYAASMLRQAGHRVALFDAMLAAGAAEFELSVRRHRPPLVAIYEDSFNFLSKMCLTRMRDEALRMIEIACDAGARVIVAGPDVSDRPLIYLERGAELALLGEADHTLVQAVKLLLEAPRDASPESIARQRGLPDGVAYLSAEGLARTAKRRSERHLDAFPSPAWDLIDFESYRTAWTRQHGYFSLNIASTRGCPYRCNWCAKPIWGQQYAVRSPDSVAREMATIKETIDPDHVWFADDIFGLKPGWIVKFAQHLKVLNGSIPFMIQTRADLMTEDAVAALASAGCVEVWLGAESGSQKILDAMTKDIAVEEILAARRRLGEAGIRVGFFLQFGYPGETFEDILLTVHMVRAALPDDIGVSVSYPLPGTRFHAMVRDQLGAQNNWIDSGDLAMMFHGTYYSPFYRRLHQVLHRDLEYERLRQQPDMSLDPDDWRAGKAPQELALAIEEEWLELGRLEKRYRHPNPSVLPAAVIQFRERDSAASRRPFTVTR